MTDAAGQHIRDAFEYQMALETRRRLYAMLNAAAASRPPASVLSPIHERIGRVDAAIAAYEHAGV